MIKGTMKVEEEKKSTAILAAQEPPSIRSVSDWYIVTCPLYEKE